MTKQRDWPYYVIGILGVVGYFLLCIWRFGWLREHYPEMFGGM